MVPDFNSKSAIVTGGGSGIGEACAVLLAARGARVLVADRNLDAARRVADTIGTAAVPYQVDVSQPAACEAMVRAAVESFGRLDVAVNNAGIPGPRALTGDYPVDGWTDVVAVNLNGTFYCMRAEIPAMLDSGGGSIVNMASAAGAVGTPMSVAYVATKHGVVGMTKTTAIEYGGQGIRVNSVGPGFIETPMLTGALGGVPDGLAGLHPLGRLGRTDEVAELVAFLASDRSSNTTGAFYLADGGLTAR